MKQDWEVRPEACNFVKNETLSQVFSCEFLRAPFSQNTSERLLLSFNEYTAVQAVFPVEKPMCVGTPDFAVESL